MSPGRRTELDHPRQCSQDRPAAALADRVVGEDQVPQTAVLLEHVGLRPNAKRMSISRSSLSLALSLAQDQKES